MSQTPKHHPLHDSRPGLPLDADATQPGVYKWPPHLTAHLQATVFLGGCIGTLARYGIIANMPTATNGWPWATFTANLLGAFILGILLETLLRCGEDKGKLRLIRLGIGTGFIGAFTTYSSLAVETSLLIKRSHIDIAIIYALVSVLGGIIVSALGIKAGAGRHRSRVGAKS